jgi:hypothetical protein
MEALAYFEDCSVRAKIMVDTVSPCRPVFDPLPGVGGWGTPRGSDISIIAAEVPPNSGML